MIKDAKEFGRAVKAARALRGWTQVQLAREVGLSDTTIKKVERGGNTNLQTILDITNVLSTELQIIDNQPS